MAADSKPPSEKKEKPPLTSEDFIVKWPLYTPFEIDGFRAPNRMSFQCNGACKKETTWMLMAEPNYQGLQKVSGMGFYWVEYSCTLCERQHLVVMYRTVAEEKRTISGRMPLSLVTVVTKVLKVGQYPPLTISIPKPLEKNLGEAAASLYKKALINRNEGYGLAAVTYIRRVVEDKTEELIEVVARLAEAHNIEPDIVKKIRAAKDERTTYDNKLKIASTVLPESLVIDGINPLGVLFGLVSAGLHDLTEEQCIAIADDTKSVFEFTFSNLRAETEKRKDFVASVKKLAGRT